MPPSLRRPARGVSGPHSPPTTQHTTAAGRSLARAYGGREKRLLRRDRGGLCPERSRAPVAAAPSPAGALPARPLWPLSASRRSRCMCSSGVVRSFACEAPRAGKLILGRGRRCSPYFCGLAGRALDACLLGCAGSPDQPAAAPPIPSPAKIRRRLYELPTDPERAASTTAPEYSTPGEHGAPRRGCSLTRLRQTHAIFTAWPAVTSSGF